MSSPNQIRLCGFGGQGIILAGVILGHAGIGDGRWVAGSASYGAQARGGYARSDVVIADEPIVFPHVIAADILIAMSQEAYDKYSQQLAPQAVVLYDQQLVTPHTLEGADQKPVPATARAVEELHSKQVANIVMLAAAVAATAMVTRDSMLAAIERAVDEKFRAADVQSAEVGFALGEQS